MSHSLFGSWSNKFHNLSGSWCSCSDNPHCKPDMSRTGLPSLFYRTQQCLHNSVVYTRVETPHPVYTMTDTNLAYPQWTSGRLSAACVLDHSTDPEIFGTDTQYNDNIHRLTYHNTAYRRNLCTGYTEIPVGTLVGNSPASLAKA